MDIFTDLFSGSLKDTVIQILEYLGIGAGVAAGGTFIFKWNQSKTIKKNQHSLKNSAPVGAGDDVINGNQTLAEGDLNQITEIHNYYCDDGDHSEEQAYQKHPQPAEIVDQVKNASPSEKKKIEAAYEGKNFKWNVKFRHIRKKGDSQYRLFFCDPDEFGEPLVYCDLDLGQHSKLKTAKEGDDMQVAGSLKCFRSHKIALDLDHISYDKEKMPARN